MSYEMHFAAASATKKHIVTYKNVPKGDAIEMDTFKILVLDKLAAAKVMTAGSAIPKIVPSFTAAPTFAGLAVLQIAAKLHILEIASTALLLDSPGKLNVFARHENWIMPNSGSNLLMSLHSSQSPREIMRTLFKFLEKEDFNQWGPVVRICHELTEFFAMKPGKNWVINVTLTD